MLPDELSGLISRTSLGDREAFRRLYAATSAKLFGICLRLMKNRTDAEDVLQEVYVKVWQNAGMFKASGYSPVAWLTAIARNHAIDRLRARRPDSAAIGEADAIPATAPTPEQYAVQAGEFERLRRCLEQLSPGRAEAVRAAYIEGYSYQELADRLEQPLNTVRTWLRRSLIRLRECLS